jgi:hypothetical protein
VRSWRTPREVEIVFPAFLLAAGSSPEEVDRIVRSGRWLRGIGQDSIVTAFALR